MDIRQGARAGMLALAFCVLTACGGGGGSDGGTFAPPSDGSGGSPGTPQQPAPYPDIPATDADAARFLTQATFGPTAAEITRVRQIGYKRWIDEQIAETPTLMLPHLQQLVANGVATPTPQNRRNYWLWQAANGRDQLRLRMAFALSEIMVVSDREVADSNATVFRIADYQDTLARGAFGSYRTLLEQVSVHPAMGYFLSHVGNRKADPRRNITPDENYGREVMQLFSIGLVKRNRNFTPVLDASGQTIPTYDEQVVSGMARVFTGWTYAGQTDAQFGRGDNTSYAPMECHAAFHDDQPKTIFDGIVINEGNNCVASLSKTLDALAGHSNVAPFISRQLIQRFVTSNPSSEYVERVANVWVDSRGDLGRVIRAVLLDIEARLPPTSGSFGKAREPLVKLATVWRAFNARYVPAATGEVRFAFSNAGDLSASLQQESQRAPSVFNFFEPDYRLPAADGVQGMFAPEFQILTEATYLSMLNQHDSLVWNNAATPPTTTSNAPYLDLVQLTALAEAKDHAGMVQRVNLLMFHGALSAATSQAMVGMLDRLATANESAGNRAKSLVLLAMATPEFAIQR
ncbi:MULTISPECIES: DUF1800 family protein [unclassified Lysobacter]|uniref:DUF1800 domain-containing protein n=1 Tax=unclassified Lysobacter TaxID=2635362 RepID=UPI001C21D5C4|nr:DUF1800 family protein [Lysobacter sp. MMG2]MBU8975590.1 DUF1800 domain-containing protein [Lysobacter sp. MMG2]